MEQPKFTLTAESITVVVKGKVYTVQKGASNYANLRKAILDENWEEIPKHITSAKSINAWAKGKFSVDDGVVKLNGEPFPKELNERIVALAAEGKDPTPILNFWERLSKNPSFRSVQQLWGFLQHEGIPITKDGYLLAYKAVRQDYKDIHSGQFDNSPGTTNEMPRNKISDDPQQACHEGFHVGAIEYARNFGGSSGRIVICKVDPENVVCVPYDSSQQKMRVSKYEVIGNYGMNLPSTVYDGTEDLEDTEETSEELSTEESAEETVEEQVAEETTDTTREADKDKKPKKSATSWDSMNMIQLMEKSIEELRKYAGKKLKIVGASKIPGGKSALVARILEVRRK